MVALAHRGFGLRTGHAGFSAGCSCLRRAGIPALWALIGYMHALGATAPVLLATTALATALGAAIVWVADEETQWSGLLAATMLLTSPVLQQYWAMTHEEPYWGRLMFLRAVVIVGGLLLLARLGAERPQQADQQRRGIDP